MVGSFMVTMLSGTVDPATGKRINNAKDNGAIWAIAQNQRATSRALDAVRESLQRGQSTVDVAISAGETVSDLLLQMKEKALAARDSGIDAASRKFFGHDARQLSLEEAAIIAGLVKAPSRYSPTADA